MIEKIFGVYLLVMMSIIAIALFIIGIFLPVGLAIAENNNWWFLLYMVSPMFFFGSFCLFEQLKEISDDIF